MFSGVLGLPRVVRWFLRSSCISCWATCRASTAVAYSLLSGSSVMDTSLRSSTSLATGGGFGGGLVRCSVMDTSLKEMLKSLALLSTMVASGEWCVFSARLSTPLATGSGFGGGLVRCNGLGSVLVWVSMSKSGSATGGGLGGGLC